jgi:hypothetical protein
MPADCIAPLTTGGVPIHERVDGRASLSTTPKTAALRNLLPGLKALNVPYPDLRDGGHGVRFEAR